jgi:negative regulator of sigma E activity
MRLFVKSEEDKGKPALGEIMVSFESNVDKTVFKLLTDNMLKIGTRVTVSTLIDGKGETMIGFRPIGVGG